MENRTLLIAIALLLAGFAVIYLANEMNASRNEDKVKVFDRSTLEK